MTDSNKNNVLIGKRLVFLRKEKGLSQKDIGEILGVTYQQVGKYERGESQLSCSSAVKLCVGLGINIQDIFPPICSKERKLQRRDKLIENIVSNLHEGIVSAQLAHSAALEYKNYR